MEIELGLKITHTRDDATSSTEFRFAKDNNGPLFFSRETATMLILIAYLRGFKRENIEIKISEDGKQLTIGGKKPVQEITLRGWIMHKKDEIREFKKIFLIPDGVNLNRTKAKFNNEESNLRITMPKLVKGIRGIEIQEVTEEHKERHEAAVQVDDQAHGKECEAEISEVAANQSLLKDGESSEECAEARIEQKEKINDVEEKAVDTMPFEKDSQVEQEGIRACESMTPATVDNSSQTDATPMEKVKATAMSKKEKTDHAADQALDAFQQDEHNQSEKDEFLGNKQDQVEQAFDELQSDKHDQMDRRVVSRSEPKAPPVLTDETSHKDGKSIKEDAESVMENKMDQMVEQQHDEADQQSDVSRRELEIPQAMIDETTQKDAKSLEKDAEFMMPGKLDQSVDKLQRDKEDKAQLSEVSRYEPKMSEDKIDENKERGIGEAQSDKVEKNQHGKLEIPEAIIDENQKNDGEQLERGSGSIIERKEDQTEKHLNGENQFDKVSSNEPIVPQLMVDTASQKIENSQEDGAELMTESKERKRNQSAEQVADEQQYEKFSQKDSSSMEEVEAHTKGTQEKTDHVVDQAFAEIQGNEFPGEKQDQVGPSFDKFQIGEQDQMNQKDVSREEPEASLVVTDESSQKVERSLEEDAESIMERKKDQLVESRHDEADKVQQREVSMSELEIPQAMIDETTQKDVKSLEEDAESMIPSKVEQMVDKPQHDEADQVKPLNVSRDEPEMPQTTIDEAIASDIDTMPKLVKAICGVEIQEVTEEHKERCEAAVPVVDPTHVKECEAEISEVAANQSLLKDGEFSEEGAAARIEWKEKINDVVEKAVDTMPFERVEQGGVRACEYITPATVDNSSQTDGTPMEKVKATAMSKKEKTDHAADRALDAFQEDEHNQSEKEEFQGDKQDQVEQAFDELQSNKHDQMDRRVVSRSETKTPPVVTDETSHKGGKSIKEDAESVMENKVDQMDEQQHDKAAQQSDVSRRELEIPQAMIDETTHKDAKSLGKEEESMMPSKLDQSVDKLQRVEADKVQLSEVSRHDPKMSQDKINENKERDIGEAQSDKVEKNQHGKLEIPEAIIDEKQKNDGKQLERGSGSMIERKEDQTEKHLNGENQSDKVDHSEQMEVSSNEPTVPQLMVGTASQKIENSQEDGAELMTESKERKRNQSAEQVADEQQYEKFSQKDSSSMEEVEAHTKGTQEKTDHVVDQAFAEIQGNEFPGEKQDQVGPSFDKFQIGEQDQMNQKDVSREEPEASLVVTDESSQKVEKSLEEDAESIMERKKDQLVESRHDEADKVQQRKVSMSELEIPQAMIDETTQKDVKSLEEDGESMIPSKVEQMVDKPQHDEADQVKPLNVSRVEPEMPQTTIDEAIANDIGKSQGDKVDSVPHREVCRRELEMQEAKIDETVQEDGKPLEESAESMMKIEEKIDQVDLVDHAEQSEPIYPEQSEVSRNEPKVSEDIVDDISRKESDVPEAMADAASGKEEKSHDDGTERMAESKEKRTDQVVEQVVDEHQYDKADHVEKRDIPTVQVDETSPEDGKSQQEAAETMTKSRTKNFQVVEKVFDEPQCDQMDHARQRAVSRCEPKMPPEIIDDTSGKDGISQAAVVKQAIDEPVCASDTNQVEKREVSRFKNEMPVVDETSLKDNSQDKTEAMMKSKEKIDQVAEKAVEQDKARGVDEVQPETESRKLIPEEKSKDPENEESKRSAEEKLSEIEHKEMLMQAIAEVMPQTIASTQSEEATPKKKQLPPFLETISRESLETRQGGQEQVTNLEPDVARGTIDMAPEKAKQFNEETTKQKLEKEERSESFMEERQLNEVDKIPDILPGIESNKLVPKEKSKYLMTEEKERPERTVEDKIDHEVGKTVDDAAPRKDVETVEETKRTEIERQDVHVKNELQLNEVETTADTSPEMDHSKLVSEENCEKQDTESGEEKHDQTKEIKDFTPETTVESDKEKEDNDLKPEVAKTAADDEPKKDKVQIEVTAKSKISSKEEASKDMHHVTSDQLNKRERVPIFSPEMIATELIEEKEPAKQKIKAKKETKKREEKFDGGESRKVPQIIKSMHLEEAIPKEKQVASASASIPETGLKFEPSETYPSGKKDVSKYETETAEVSFGEVTRKEKQALQETKLDGTDETDQAVQDMVNESQPSEVEDIAQISMKDDGILIPEGKYEKPDKERKDEPEKVAGEKLHDKEFKGMEGPAQLVPQSVTSKQLEESSFDADKHPVSSESYPETVTPQVETSKTHQVVKKDASKQKPDVGKVSVDEQPAKDEESLDEFIDTKAKGKEGIDQVERQWHLTEIEKAAETSADMDRSEPLTGEELEKPKLKMKEETEKAVKEKLDEGPKKIDLVLQTIAAVQTEEDSPKRTRVPSISVLHPKMTSNSDASESHHDGVEEATEREPEVKKNAVDEASQKEEEMFQETRKPNIKIEEGSDQAVRYVAKEVPKKENTFQEITKPKIKMEEESDQAMQHVADDLVINEFEEASAVSPGVDHRTLLPEESSGNSMVKMKEKSEKREENVDEEGSNTTEEATAVVPEITTAVKLEEFHPGVKEDPVISPSHQETPKLGPDISDARRNRLTDVSKWEPESIKSATDKMLQKDNLPPESVDSQIKSENIRDHVAEVALEDSSKMVIGKPTPENTSQIPEIEAFDETKRTVAETVDEGESKTEEDENLVTEAEPDASLAMQSEEASPEGEEHPANLASYAGSRAQESDDSKGVHFGEKKVRRLDSELARFPAGDALEKDEELAEEIFQLEEIDQAKDIIKVSPETDVSKSVPKKIDEEPKMEMKEETEKLADENADKEELKKKIDAADTVPQIIVRVKEEEASHKKEECHAIPAFCPTPQGRDHGKGSETATDRETQKDQTSFLADELPRDVDHGKRSETAPPERQEVGMSFEGHMKPASDRERVQHDTPILADDQNNGRDHKKDEDSRQGYESERDMKESELSTEGPMKHEAFREQVETPIPEDQPQQNSDRAEDEKQGQRNGKTPEKQEVGMSFEEPAAPDKKRKHSDSPLLGDEVQNQDLREEEHEQGNEVESKNSLPEMFFEGPMEPEPDQKIEQVETTLLADEPAQSSDGRQDEVQELYSEIESEKMETQVIPEGPMRPETDKEEEQVETPVLADKQGQDKGRRKAKVYELGQEIEELHDEVQLPEQKETEEPGYPETEMQKDFRIEQTSRKMDTVVPIKCKLRSFLFFAGSTFLLPLIMIVMKKSLIEFKSKKR